MDNITQQADEIEALSSIFVNEWNFNSETDSYCIQISKDVELWITLHPAYPSDLPPKYQLLAPTLTKAQKDLVHIEFQTIFENEKGCPIIYQWIEKLKEIAFVSNPRLTVSRESDNHNTQSDENEESRIEDIDRISYDFKAEVKIKDNDANFDKFDQFYREHLLSEITHGPIIVDRKSTFQGHVCKVTSQQQFRDFLDFLLQNKKIASAAHNISAFRIVTGNVTSHECEDDGEAMAGGRLLHLLDIMDLKNVAVVVTRWYGGIHLGPDRFKHYNNAARQALIEGRFISTK